MKRRTINIAALAIILLIGSYFFRNLFCFYKSQTTRGTVEMHAIWISRYIDSPEDLLNLEQIAEQIHIDQNIVIIPGDWEVTAEPFAKESGEIFHSKQEVEGKTLGIKRDRSIVWRKK